MSQPQGDGICIMALGMATALAPNLIDSCAAARAGIRRMAELKSVSLSEFECLGQEPITGFTARYIAPGFCGLAKALLLAQAALTDLQSRRSLREDGFRTTGVYLNVSDQFYADSIFDLRVEEDPRFPSTVWAHQCEDLIPRLLRFSGLETVSRNHHVYLGGGAGFVRAVEDAVSMLLAGTFDRCLVGGVDSCIEPRFMIGAAAKGALKTSANPVGFIPGEAAAFVLLECGTDARRWNAAPAGFLLGSSFIANGPKRLAHDPPDGIGLAEAIDQAIPLSSIGEQPATIISDLNGDEYRARDWGSALSRLLIKHRVGDARVLIPALAFGEIGAASGPVGLCLGIVGQERGWISRGPIVQWCSSDKGSRGALCFKSSLPTS